MGKKNLSTSSDVHWQKKTNLCSQRKKTLKTTLAEIQPQKGTEPPWLFTENSEKSNFSIELHSDIVRILQIKIGFFWGIFFNQKLLQKQKYSHILCQK